MLAVSSARCKSFSKTLPISGETVIHAFRNEAMECFFAYVRSEFLQADPASSGVAGVLSGLKERQLIISS